MSKVKIVQIAPSFHAQYSDQYLDDKGRVWFLASDGSGSASKWKQFDLPDEPELERRKTKVVPSTNETRYPGTKDISDLFKGRIIC